MRLTIPFALFAATILATPGAAQVQAPPSALGISGSGMIFFAVDRNTPLKEKLKLTDEQVNKLREAMKPIHDKRHEMLRGLNPAEVSDERLKQMQEETVALIAESKKIVQGVLKPEQFTRLQQIDYQMAGAGAFADPDVQAALKMTDDQKKQIKTILDEFRDSVQKVQKEGFKDFRPGGDREAMKKKLEEMRARRTTLAEETEKKAMKVLTDPQKKAWVDMQGEKFGKQP
jgi:Spy/CpxP family protein refolding chaperone